MLFVVAAYLPKEIILVKFSYEYPLYPRQTVLPENASFGYPLARGDGWILPEPCPEALSKPLRAFKPMV